MNYIDRNGQITTEDSSQDRLLHLLYTHTFGRILLRPLISPVFSKMGGFLLNTPLSACLINSFIRRNHMDMTPYPSVRYHSYNDFFTRRIKPSYRPIAENNNALISPCDGKISVYPITDHCTLRIKHTRYTVAQLLHDEQIARHYAGGYAIVIRLTVDDYHRYCFPATGTKSRQIHIPGIFHTVNPIANDVMPIYKMNTREYCLIKTPTMGTVLMMEVGALLVGKIFNYQTSACPVKKGDEKGRFEFGGSTVVLMVQKDTVQIDADLLENTRNQYETFIHYGEHIGTIKKIDTITSESLH